MVDPRVRLLEDFGLMGYTARAYLALQDLGPAMARVVANRAAIPQGRVYDVLDKLAARGLVEVLPEVPKRYKAAPFAEFLERQVAEHHARAETLARDRSSLEQAMRPLAGAAPPEQPGDYVVVRGRRNVVERVGVLLGTASKDVLAVGLEPGTAWVRRHEAPLAEALARGVRLRALLPLDPGSLAAAAEAAKRGVEVRHGPDVGPLNLVAFDGAQALLYGGGAGWGAEGRAENGILVRDPGVVQGLRALAEALWAAGTDLGARLREPPSQGAASEPAAPGLPPASPRGR